MSGNTDTLALGIRYAVDSGAKILNVSVNTDAATSTVAAAVRYAGERGAVVVASAGNNGRNIDLVPSYPASLTDPAVFSVAAAGEGGLLWQLSNTGLLSVDLAAPGDHIVSTARGSSYQSRTGTSAAAPFVSGLARAAVRSPPGPPDERPAHDDHRLDEAHERPDLAAGRRPPGRRRRDAPRARRARLADERRERPPSPAGQATLTLRTRARACAGTRVAVRWTARGADAVTRWRVSLDGRVVEHASTPSKARFTRRVARAGRHTWRVVGFDADGREGRRRQARVPRRARAAEPPGFALTGRRRPDTVAR